MSWKPADTIVSWFWVYVPGFATEPKLPEGTPIVQARMMENGVLVTVRSNWVLRDHLAPTHWADASCDPRDLQPPVSDNSRKEK